MMQTAYADRSRRKTPLLLAFLIPSLILLAIYAIKGIYPFGDQCFLRIDMYHQYAPFHMDFLRRLQSGQSLTYAFNVGLGSNYLALFAYYLCSPTQLLLYLIPENALLEFTGYLILIKLGLCGLTMAWYLSEKFGTRHAAVTFLGCCYALCGYTAAYNWNLMWLDCLILAPVILLGLERLVRDGRPFLYCITLALAILTNYYIAIMLCIYLVLYFLCLLLMQPEGGRPLRSCLLFAGSSLIAGGIAAVLLLPAAMALGGTASADSTMPSSLTSYFSVIEMLARHMAVVTTETGLDHWPNLYCGTAVFLLLPMYYLNKRVSYKEKILKTVLLVILLLSFALNIPNYLWHGMHLPNSLPARQSFLYTILILTMCMEGYKGFGRLSKGQIAGIFWGAAAFILLCQVIVDVDDFDYYVFYASLLFVALYALALYLYRARHIAREIAYSLILCTLVIELLLNTGVTSINTVDRTQYWGNTESYQTLLREHTAGEVFTRADKNNRKTKNDSAWTGYNSASIFSSVASKGVSDLYKKLGLEGNTNAYSFTGSTPLTASLLSVHYILETQSLPDSPLYRLAATEGDAYLYENLYTLPLGFLVPSDLDGRWSFADTDPATEQNRFVNEAAGTGDVLLPVSGSTDSAGFRFRADEEGHYYVYVTNTRIDDVKAQIGTREKSFSNVKRGYLLDLGFCEAGTDVLLSCSDGESLTAEAWLFDDARFIDAYRVLSGQGFAVEDVRNSFFETSVTGSVDVTQAGTLLLSIPFDRGWTVQVDGTRVSAKAFAGALLSIDLPEGSHTVRLQYVPEGLKLGALISGGSLVLLILWAVTDRAVRGRRKKQAAEDARLLAEKLELTEREALPAEQPAVGTEEILPEGPENAPPDVPADDPGTN